MRALVVATMLAGCSSDASDANHAPVVQPASVTLHEDQDGMLAIHAEDVDGDGLELTMYSAFGGQYDLEKVAQSTVDGTNRLDAEVASGASRTFMARETSRSRSPTASSKRARRSTSRSCR